MRSIVLMAALLGCGGTGNSNNGVETCTQALCPSGGHTYRYCSAPHAASCRYLGSDGTIFNCVSCSNCVAAADEVSTWCATGQGPTGNTTGNTGNTTGSTTGGVVDMAMKRNPDLALPPNGCNGFDQCLSVCAQQNQNNPTGYSDCANNTCATNATDNAINLWVQAYFVCPAQHFCSSTNDAGVIPCSAADLDPNATTVSDSCNQCLNDAYTTNASGIQTACKSDITACLQDKP